jgi:PAS domain-containing protein
MKQTTAELTRLNEQLHQEIAERRRVEAALQESQRSLSTLLSNLPGMVYRCRND